MADLVYSSNLAASPRISADSFTSLSRSSREAFSDLCGALRPWEGRNASQRAARNLKLASDRVKSVVGDPDSPEFAAREQLILAEMQSVKEFDESEVEEGEVRLVNAVVR